MVQNTLPKTNAIISQLNWIFLLRIVLYTALLGFSYFLREESSVSFPSPLTTLFLLTVYCFTIFSALQLQRYNQKISRIVFLQILIDNLFAAFFVYITGASTSIFTSAFFFPIISGALFLNGISSLSQSAVAAVLYALILILEFKGILPDYIKLQNGDTIKSFNVLIQCFTTQSLLFFLVGFLSFLLGSRLQKVEFALASSRKEFQQLSQLHKHIFENISNGIISIKPDHSISEINQAGLDILQRTKEDLLGIHLGFIFPTIDLQVPHENEKLIYTYDDQKKIISYATAILLQPGTQKTLNTLGQHQVIVFKDITSIEKLESQLYQAEKLAAIGTMSASIAHDFRNPLTAALGCTQILIEDVTNDETDKESQLELLNIIEKEATRLLTTISNFLFFARPNTPQFSWFSVNQCLKDAYRSCCQNPKWPSTCQVKINISNRIDIHADREQLSTIFTHLLENAIVFCHKGAEVISVTISDKSIETSCEGIEIKVEDNGQGVAPEDYAKIFDPFYTTRADGTGLGLSIVKQYVLAHGGSITLQSSTMGGACFRIYLPFPDDATPYLEKEPREYYHQT